MESQLRPPIDPGFCLIETFLWTPESGVQHRDLHLARLARSAALLGITPHGVASCLEQLAGAGPLRVRLTVDRAGQAQVTTAPFTPLAPMSVWCLKISSTRLDARDPWLRIKSSQRALYDQTRATLSAGVDEVIFLNQDGIACEGTITNLFADFGTGLVTPAAPAGLLPGILRQHLLDQGDVREEQILGSDLLHAKKLFVGNSLRGLIAAQLV